MAEPGGSPASFERPEVGVFKTHDVGPVEFAAVCAAVPELRVLTVSRDLRDSVVSRYFYFRYYWPERYAAGTLPGYFKDFLAKIGDAPDGEALRALLDAEFANGWAREWAAFEMPLGTERALRVTYSGMLDESEFGRIAEFTGLPLRRRRAFEIEQAQETQNTGREGRARFNRSGCAGGWRDWWSEAEGERLMALGREWLARMGGPGQAGTAS